MPPMNSIDLIREFLAERLDVPAEQVTESALLTDLGVDSLMLLELIFEFEDRYDIKLSPDIKTPQSVGEMVSLMDGLIARHKS